MTTNSGTRFSGRVCAFRGCTLQTSDLGYPLCRRHYNEAQRGTITKCSKCVNFKPARFLLCDGCLVGGSSRATSRQEQNLDRPSVTKNAMEGSPPWELSDRNAAYFYTYILRLDDGEYYIGQTRELSLRLSEHRDGKVSTTRGKYPELVWFTELSSREEATKLEAELKQIRERDERSIRRIIVRFQSLVRELAKD